MKAQFVFLFMMVIFPFSVSAIEPIIINYPSLASGKYQASDRYYIDLIELVAEKIDSPISIQGINMPEVRQDRAILLLKKGSIDVYWMMTNKEREQELLPIRIPLYRGLIGWRLMLIHEDDRDMFTQLKSTDDIRHLRAVQGHDWPDVDILEANGYNVTRSHTWSGLFEMVFHRRVDYFPRSVIEIHDELESRAKMKLAIEPSVVFRYPTAYYFFVSKNNIAIATMIETGLNKAIQDGSFNRLFMRYYGNSIRQSMLEKRKKIDLDNPGLPPKTPIDRAELWFSI